LKNSTFIARSSGKSSRLVAGTPTRLLSSLSFQISAAFLLLLLLFGAASLYSVGAFQRQIDYSSLIDTAGKLELTAQYLHMQAMNYEQNAPRDYPTYFRDVRLYLPGSDVARRGLRPSGRRIHA